MIRIGTLLLNVLILGLTSCVSGQPLQENQEPTTPQFQINPPKPKTDLALSVADFGAKPNDGQPDWKAFNEAIAACKQRGAAKLIIPKGRYNFNDPEIRQTRSVHISLKDVADLVIDGQGSELLFHNVTDGIRLERCKRLVFKNLIMDWDYPTASPGTVKKGSDGGKVIEIADGYRADANTRFGSVTEFDTLKQSWISSPREVHNPPNIRMVAPLTYASEAFAVFAEGASVLVRHHVYNGSAFRIYGPGNADIAFEDITVYACPGKAFFGTSCDSGFRLTRCVVKRKDAPKRFISACGDGIQFTAARGNILIEDCDISSQGDDAVNIHSVWMRVVERPDARTLVLSCRYFGFLNVDPGDELQFRRFPDLNTYGTAKVAECVRDEKQQQYRIRFAEDLPAGISAGDLVASLSRTSGNYIIRNSTFRDSRTHGIVVQAPNGLIENNKIINTPSAGIHVVTDIRRFFEGYGCSNVIVRGNTLERCNYSQWWRNAKGRVLGALTVSMETEQGLSETPVHRNILIENNTIRDTPGMAILISSADGVIVRNNEFIDANLEPYDRLRTGADIDAAAKGTVMVTRASRVMLTNNRQSGTKQSFEKGVYVDKRNTRSISVKQ